MLVVGEGPGADEDRTGRPFVGPAGQFLDKWLQAVELSRERTASSPTWSSAARRATATRCPRRPPPAGRSSSGSCALLAPKAILSLGRVASRTLLERESPIGSLRGRVHDLRGTPLVPTYHPRAVLRSEELKRPVWEDLKRLKGVLEGGGPHG